MKAIEHDNLTVSGRRRSAAWTGWIRLTTLADLAGLPSNRLERLQGNRKGQHSIRINDQWRICFIWEDEGPTAVEIVDYHQL